VIEALPEDSAPTKERGTVIATYRSPLPEPQQRQIKKTLADYDEFMKKNPGQTPKSETTRQLDQSRELLAKGIASRIELASGLVVDLGTPQLQTSITNFRWLNRIDPKEFFDRRTGVGRLHG